VSANIQLFYYTGPYTSTLLPTADALLARLNTVRRERFGLRTVGEQRALDLAALRVLELGMECGGHRAFALKDVEYPVEAGITGKPRWRAGPIDFSISHAKAIAACAIASGCKVGLDVEDHRIIDPRTVRRLMPEGALLARDLDASNALSRWTQIEAVIKGAGLGVMHGREIDWQDRTIVLRGEQWWVHAVDCGSGHVGHVAVNAPNVSLTVMRVAEI
jgi:hypothetical protein